jgi:glycosyltransferase involved in cell wall biosynthesis
MVDHQQPPRVSVGLPVYNGERYLREAIDAILGQTFKDLELIISDNASTDTTEQICRTYVSSDPRVRYYRNIKNRGAARNFNRVFDLARGEYFKWAAVDDLIALDNIESCVEALERNPRAVLAYTLATHIDAAGEAFSSNGVLGPVGFRGDRVERFKQLLHRFNKDFGVSAPMILFGTYRRAALARVRPMGGYFASDLVLLAELALIGDFVEVPDRLLSIRLHPGSSSWPDTWSYESIMEFYDPEVNGVASRTFQMQRYHIEYFNAVARSDLGIADKAGLFLFCTRPPLKRLQHKLRTTLSGRG